VTLADLTRSGCACGKPQKAVGGSGKLSLRELRGLGTYCVRRNSTDEVVRCYRSKKTAHEVARGFGPGFRVDSGRG
jgi:hypothetical protein